MKRVYFVVFVLGLLFSPVLKAQEEIFVPKAWEAAVEKKGSIISFDAYRKPLIDNLGNMYFFTKFSDVSQSTSFNEFAWQQVDKYGKIIWKKNISFYGSIGALDEKNNFYCTNYNSKNEVVLNQYDIIQGNLKRVINLNVPKEHHITRLFVKNNKIFTIRYTNLPNNDVNSTISCIDFDGKITWETILPLSIYTATICKDNTIEVLSQARTNLLLGVHKYNLLTGANTFTKTNIPFSYLFSVVSIDEDGYIFICTSEAGGKINLHKYSPKGELALKKEINQITHTKGIISPHVIEIDKNGYLYALILSGEIRINNKLLSQNLEWYLKIDKEGNLINYIGLEKSIHYKYNGTGSITSGTHLGTPFAIKDDYLHWINIEHNTDKSSKAIFNKSLFPLSMPMSHTIKGKIFADQNQNCQMENGEKGLENFAIKINPLNGYTLSDKDGNFRVALPKGNYNLEVLAPEKSKYLVEKSCTASVNFTSIAEVKEVNLGQKVKNIPQLDVKIASNRRRRCFTNQTTITYENSGFADARNVQIKVLFPPFVKPVRSNLAWKSKLDSVLIYEIPFLSAGERKSFVITDSVVCGLESIRGLTQCTKVTISSSTTPNQPPISAQWNKADLVLEGYCLNKETVRFMVQNQGEGNMTDSLEYKVYFNNKLARIARFKLAAGADMALDIARKDRTVRFEVEQVPLNPKPEKLSKTIEICSEIFTIKAPTANIMAGYPIQMPPENDGKETIQEVTAVSCLLIRDSYDPNDKQVFPQGIENKYITDKDELTYLVRFQNTGSDTAYRVVVEDTIDTKNLDMSTFQIAGASHTYEREIISSESLTIVKFIFNNINLPHQKVDDRGSNGFVQFRIRQKAGNPKGTTIQNKAYIYFDFNSAIITNQTQSIVWDLPFYEVSVAAARNPHPDIKTACLKIESIKTQEQILSTCETQLILPNPSAIGTWKNTNSSISISQNATQTTLSNLPAGTSQLEWVEKNACQEKTSPYKINVILIPEPSISQENLFLVANAQIADSFQWFLNGVKIEGATAQRYMPEKTGNYTVLVSKNNCQKLSPVFKLDVLDNENTELSKLLEISAVDNTLQIRMSFAQTGQVQMRLINAEGKIILEQNFEKKSIKMDYLIDTQAFSKGIYLLFLQNAQGQWLRKWVKM